MSEHGPLRTADFDYPLPPELIAQTPAEPRDSARLLVVPRDSGPFQHAVFRDLPRYLAPNDLLVLNRTRVLPARLRGHRADAGGGRVELLLLHPTGDGAWEALIRPARRLRPGTPLVFGEGRLRATVLARTPAGTAHVRLEPAPDEALLRAIGEMPLPPYIHRWDGDPDRYQTVYAEEPGSAAAPTAGLHFTSALLAALREQGVGTVFVTLHVGLDTFRPIHEEDPHAHVMHREWCEVPAAVLQAAARARRAGGRVIAVGTTSVRALESAAAQCATPTEAAPGDAARGYAGWTDLYITPGYRYRAIDGLITNFHLPRSTLLLLVSALVGRERLLAAYAEAIRERYRFYSFGDAMLIL
ncbi:MAG TPA: tRNA preQ1(34) S-adenosylmethionine ribosyltransferase-isomerase QueA [Chloroflexota bacterium]|nr:tRNA preQ1(34) S-adenosylmethionine ribosyltransferase-isomerase QueA [Chloroflexota bacterium]